MMAGAVAFFVYASHVSRILMRYKFRVIPVTLCSKSISFPFIP